MGDFTAAVDWGHQAPTDAKSHKAESYRNLGWNAG